MLRMYVGKSQQSWNKWLYFGEFAYNQKLHSNIDCTPLFTLYGQDCNTPMNSRFEIVYQIVKEMNEVIESIKLSMRNAQDRTKHYANKKRSFREFKAGGKISWKVTP